MSLRVLVLTERYPPDVAGGGEVSLATTLQALPPEAAEVRVLALTARREPWPDDDASITRLPVTLAWPPPTDTARHGRELARALMNYVVSGNTGSAADRAGRILLRGALRACKRESFFPFQDQDVLAQRTVLGQIRKTVEGWNPSLVHADNALAIILASAALPPSLPLVGMIRDNRFFCGRRDQRANINGRPCGLCEYACVEAVPRSLRAATRRQMTGVMELRRHSLQRLQRAIVPSAYLRDQLQRLQPDLPITIVPNPVALRPSNLEPAAEPRVLSVGTVTIAKGQGLIARMLPRLHQAVPDIRYEVPGHPSADLAAMLDEAAAQGVAPLIDHPGFLGGDALLEAYRRARVVAIPGSFQEGFGRVAVEAARMGRPVVAFAHGATPEMVIDGATGLLVAPGDEAAFETALLKLLTDAGLAQRMGRAAQERASSRFLPEHSARGFLSVWRDLSDPPA